MSACVGNVGIVLTYWSAHGGKREQDTQCIYNVTLWPVVVVYTSLADIQPDTISLEESVFVAI
jgi:hypothetical protein